MSISNWLHKIVRILPSKKLRAKLDHWIHLKTGCEAELKNITRILPDKRRTAIDAGANNGHYSVELSRYFKQVFAFEINKDLSSELFSVKNNIKLINEGLSSKESETILYTNLKPQNKTDRLSEFESWKLSGRQRASRKKVSTKPLDFYNFDNVDFIKIDVEGHEYELLKGGRRRLDYANQIY